jgi:predicted dehydrogenase
MQAHLTRRQFLRSSALAAAGCASSPVVLAQGLDAAKTVVLGLVGCGARGLVNLRHFLDLKGVEIGAVCDVDAEHVQAAVAQVLRRGRRRPQTYTDYRRLVEQRDLDAVIIATPDHWHALVFVAACEAGKDIYCETPLSHSLVEAKTMWAAARRFKRVVQVGTWQRSVPHFQEAVAFVRSGQLGPISLCRAWFVQPLEGLGSSLGRAQPQDPPPQLDWDLWLGPAPKVPYAPNRCHQHWRWFFDYGGGLMTEWGLHLIDTVLLAMQETDPLTVQSAGGKFVLEDDRDTPDTMLTVYRFPKWVLQWEGRLTNGRGLEGERSHGVAFLGSRGTLVVDRAGYQWYPETPQASGPPSSTHGPNTHWQNFVDCIRSRQRPSGDIDSVARTTMVCHLGNIALQSGRMLWWDATQQDVANRADVRSAPAYQRAYRAPWKLPTYSEA